MVDEKKVWVVGKFIKMTDQGSVWDLSGIFDDEKDAVASCIGDKYFVGPMLMNKNTFDEQIVWPGVYYPNLKG